MSKYAKAVAAILAQVITQAIALGLLSGSAAAAVQLIGAALTAFVVYQVKNAGS